MSKMLAPLGRLVLLVLGLGAVWSLTLQGADTRIVIVAGKPSHPPGMHEFRAGALLLQKALAGIPGVTVDVYANGWPSKMLNGAPADDSDALADADAVLIYSDGGRGNPAIVGDHMRVIDSLAAKGVGLGFAHYAVEVPAGAPGEAMHRWVGGYYETNYSVNPMWTPRFGTFPAHPVTEGVKPFATHDEWYFNMRWTPDAAARARMTDILSARPDDDVRNGPYVSPPGPYPHIVAESGRTESMMWVYERPGGGRSFGFTGGHTHTNWGDVNQRRVVLNALLWMARVAVPAGGVVDTITPADLTVNLDPKTR